MEENQDLRIMKNDMRLHDGELHMDFFYPRHNEIKSLVLGLCDVRASDDIRISFDFERDGWKIEQASTFEWDCDDTVCDLDWQEVAFIPAWGREKRKEQL